MAGRIDTRLKELGIELPTPANPAGTYVPFVVTGNLVFISGQGPMAATGITHQGKLGKEHDVDAGKAAARLTMLNVLAQLKAACGGDLDRVKRAVKILGFVNATPEFDQQPTVINGASDLLVEIFGDSGRHARSAVSAPSLPFQISVEIEAVFEIA